MTPARNSRKHLREIARRFEGADPARQDYMLAEVQAAADDLVRLSRPRSPGFAVWMRNERGQPFQCDEIHRVCDAFFWDCVKDGVDMGYMGPTGHGKTLWGLAMMASLLGGDSSLRVKIVSNDGPAAALRATTIASAIERNEDFRRIYPDCRPSAKWGVEGYRLQRPPSFSQIDPSIEPFGVFSNSTGSRADVLLCDDPTSLENSLLSPGKRDKVFLSIVEGMTSRMMPKRAGDVRGTRVYMANPWHFDDCSARLQKDKALGFRFLTIWMNETDTAMIVYVDGKKVREIPLAAKLGWDAEAIADRKRTLGERGFARLFHGQPISEDDSSFPMRLMRRNAYEWTGHDSIPWKTGGEIICALDPGFTGDSAVFVALWRPYKETTAGGRPVYYLLPEPYTRWGRWGHELSRTAASAWGHLCARAVKPTILGIEVNGAQMLIPANVQQAADELGYPIPRSSLLEITSVHNKQARIRTMVGDALDMGELRLPVDKDGEWLLPVMIGQLFELGATAHDDHADALHMAILSGKERAPIRAQASLVMDARG